MKTKTLAPQVNIAHKNMINAHFQSLRNKGGKKLKKNTVHEKPTGASFISPVIGFLKSIDVYAILYIPSNYLLTTNL